MLSTGRQLLRESRSVLRKHGVSGLSGAVFNYLTRPLLMPMAIGSLRHRAANLMGVEESVRFAMEFRFGNIHIAPMQNRSEIAKLCACVRTARPNTVLEIGTAKGGTLFLFAKFSAPDAYLVSVDLPFGAFGGGYPAWRTRLYRAFAGPAQHMTLLREDSHAPGTHADVKRALAGRAVDFLFIDGDHTYDGVAADFHSYSSLVRPGGMIAFHDIVPGPENDAGGVYRFWQDLKASKSIDGQFVEFVESWSQGGLGIGVIQDFRTIR